MNNSEILEIPPFYQPYLKQAEAMSLLDGLHTQQEMLQAMLANLPEEKGRFCYAPGKWSLNGVIRHMSDAERIFAFRALCFARGEQQSLPGFEEDEYSLHMNADAAGLRAVLNEFGTVRAATISLFSSFDDGALDRIGTANGNRMSVRTIGLIGLGHAMHHTAVISDRYLK